MHPVYQNTSVHHHHHIHPLPAHLHSTPPHPIAHDTISPPLHPPQPLPTTKMTEFVTPQLRTVLKTYQDSATKSLHGPGLSLVHSLKKELLSPNTSSSPIEQCDDDFRSAAPLPIPPEISQPILSTADTGPGVLYETILEGKPIGCFLLGGEMRLCIPQILNNVLTDFSLDEIHRIIDEQRIFCSTCTPDQLMEFKAAKILPDDVNTAGLITRTNAERLCSALLHRSSNLRRHQIAKYAIAFRVHHRCFGKAEGICTPELYSWKDQACIECVECRGMFSPQQFVCHVHRQENGTLHWGFDSNNWRNYLRVGSGSEKLDAVEVEDGLLDKYAMILDEMHEQHLLDAEAAAERDDLRDMTATLKRKVSYIFHSLIVYIKLSASCLVCNKSDGKIISYCVLLPDTYI